MNLPIRQTTGTASTSCWLIRTTLAVNAKKPGLCCFGIPGILAHMENGRLAEGAKVNRCDLCQCYPSDEAALEKLRQLDRAPS